MEKIYQVEKKIMKHLKIFTKEDILNITHIRRFETKLGEKIHVTEAAEDVEKRIQNSNALFVIVGVPEDIGIKGNLGIGGADTAWQPFLHSFLNIQSNDFLHGDEILLLGQFDFSGIKELIEKNSANYEEKIKAYRQATAMIDEEVEQLVSIISRNNKIPIIVGGGHNNAYGCIKGAAKGLYHAGHLPIAEINAINLDAHADYRPLEGRHSGNSFRYAEEDGYLEKYCIIGLHENYLTQNMWLDIANNPFLDFISFEDIFIHEKRTFRQALAHACSFTETSFCGIELDLDSIENVLSSAFTPVGISAIHARQYVQYAAQNCMVAYLHICEGATQLADNRRSPSTGKLIAYLVSDFIKAIVEKSSMKK